MIAQFMLGKGLPGKDGLKLKPSVRKYLKHKMQTFEEVVPPGTRSHEVTGKRMSPYASDDALQCLRLGEFFRPYMEDYRIWKPFVDLECEFVPVLVQMQEAGIKIDPDHLEQLHGQFSSEIKDISVQFAELVGISELTGRPVEISSSAQVSSRLYEELGWWPTAGLTKGKSGRYSVNKEILKDIKPRLKKGTLGYQALDLKLQYSAIATLVSTFTLTLVKHASIWQDGRLHPEFIQTRAATGRLASSKPNGQNIPKKGKGIIIRKGFISEEGWKLGVADYSQADLRMMAHLSKDANLVQAYLDNRDIHTETAKACGCSRDDAKAINFGLIYELQEKGLANQLGCSVSKARAFIKNYFANYPGVRKYQDTCHKYAEEYGYIRTITGRIRFLPDIYSKNWGKKARAMREASNTPDQGSVADVIKIAMRNLYRDWRDRGVLFDYRNPESGKAKILSQVHDEIICELRDDFAEEGAEDITRHLENAVQLRVPMVAETGLGLNWLEAKH